MLTLKTIEILFLSGHRLNYYIGKACASSLSYHSCYYFNIYFYVNYLPICQIIIIILYAVYMPYNKVIENVDVIFYYDKENSFE